MKPEAAAKSSTASGKSSTDQNIGRRSHEASFARVLDRRKQPVRGLWERNGLPTGEPGPLTTVRKRPLFGPDELESSAAFATRKNEAGETVDVTKNGQKFVDYVKLLAYSGARRNEALALRWSDVSVRNRRMA